MPDAHTRSFWHQRNRTILPNVDVLIVGAGIVGLSTGYWLRRVNPGMSVLIVERGRIASGASGRNAGFLLQGHATSFQEDVDRLGYENARLFWQFTLDNRDLVLSSFDSSRIDSRTSGSLTVAGTPEEGVRLKASSELLTDAGFASAFLEEPEANRVLSSQRFHGALAIETGTVVDPVRLARAIAEDSGVEILEGVNVERVLPAGRGSVIEADNVRIEAGRVVVAVNSATALLLPELTGTVVPRRAQMFMTRPLPYHLDRPVYSHEGYYYVRQLENGQLLLGGARNLHTRAETGYEDATTSALQSDLSKYLQAHFPWADGHVVERRWSGTMGFTEDRLPRIGELPSRGRVTWVGGFSGHGMSVGFLMGRVLADIVTGGTPHPAARLLQT